MLTRTDDAIRSRPNHTVQTQTDNPINKFVTIKARVRKHPHGESLKPPLGDACE